MLVCSLKSASASFPASFLLATHDGLTALLSFPVDSGSGHFLHKRREMSASLPSPSLKFGMTHVQLIKQNKPGYISTELIQGIAAIIDEVDAGAIGYDGQTEEAAGSGRCPSTVYQPFGDLGTAGRSFHDPAVGAVRGQNIAVGSDGEAERVANRAVGGDIIAGMSGGRARQRMRDASDAVVQTIGDIEGPITPQSYAGRPDHQSRWIGALREAGANDGGSLPAGHVIALSLVRDVQVDAQDGSLIDHLATRSDGAIQHIGDEERRRAARVGDRHIPGPIDERTGEGFDNIALAVQNEQTACPSGVGHAVSGG